MWANEVTQKIDSAQNSCLYMLFCTKTSFCLRREDFDVVCADVPVNAVHEQIMKSLWTANLQELGDHFFDLLLLQELRVPDCIHEENSLLDTFALYPNLSPK